MLNTQTTDISVCNYGKRNPRRVSKLPSGALALHLLLQTNMVAVQLKHAISTMMRENRRLSQHLTNLSQNNKKTIQKVTVGR